MHQSCVLLAALVLLMSVHGVDPESHATIPGSPTPLSSNEGDEKTPGFGSIFSNSREEADAYNARVAAETLEESVHLLAVEELGLPGAFISTDSSSFPPHRLRLWLHDTRVARIMVAATQRDVKPRKGAKTRAMILRVAMAEVTRYLDERSAEGQEIDPWAFSNAMKSGWVFPQILAETDDTGASLPLLLRWYDLDQQYIGGTPPEIASRANSDSGVPLRTENTEAMLLIPVAALEIMERLAVVDLSQPEFCIPAFKGRGTFTPNHNLTFGPVAELEGYEMPRQFYGGEEQLIMVRLRDYLAKGDGAGE